MCIFIFPNAIFFEPVILVFGSCAAYVAIESKAENLYARKRIGSERESDANKKVLESIICAAVSRLIHVCSSIMGPKSNSIKTPEQAHNLSAESILFALHIRFIIAPIGE